MCVCVFVCVCVERERERERERNCILSQACYPKIHLSVLQTVCVCIFRFIIGLFSFFFLFCFASFFSDAPPFNQDKKVSKDNFSIIYLLRTVCELTFSIKQMHYKTGTPWHSDASILFTSGNVLDKRHSDAFILFTSAEVPSHRLLVQKSFWIKDRTQFLQKQCTVCAAFADAEMSFLERLMSGRSLFPWSLAFFLLFLGSVQSLAAGRFVYKPAICEDG